MKKGLVATLSIWLLAMTGFNVDIYVPALPEMTHLFHSHQATLQYSITAYILGYGIAQVVSGLLVGVLGKKRLLVLSLALYCIATMGLPWVHSAGLFIAIRIVQGVGMGAPGVISKALLPENFEGSALHKWVGVAYSAWAISPLMAPLVGSLMQRTLPWWSPFMVLLVLAFLALLLVIMVLPKQRANTDPNALKSTLSEQVSCLRSRLFLLSICAAAGAYSVIIVFPTMGPFLIQREWHYSAWDYAQVAMGLGFGWFVGAVLTRVMLQRFPLAFILPLSLTFLVLVSANALALQLFFKASLWLLIANCLPIMILASSAFTVLSAHNMSKFKKYATLVSMMQGIFPLATAAFVTLLIGFVHVPTALTFVLFYVAIAVYCVGCYFVARL